MPVSKHHPRDDGLVVAGMIGIGAACIDVAALVYAVQGMQEISTASHPTSRRTGAAFL